MLLNPGPTCSSQDLFPELQVPIPAVLQNQNEWSTTYLDGDTRVNRSSNGAVFLFRRKWPVGGGARAAAAYGR